jgi:hypothetical protein
MTDLAVQTGPPNTPVEPLEHRSLPRIAAESRLQRACYVLLALGLVGLFTLHWYSHWVAAHPGVDQNGYLVGGKMLAENLSMRLSPTEPGTNRFDPHQFVGRMWVGADFGTVQERYYPKYPIGLPALYAVALWIGGERWGLELAYLISPLAMTLSVAATFLLVRLVAGSFWAFCGAAVYASSTVVMSLTTNPNSHATAVCAAAWGMYLLLRWWQTGTVWRAVCAGLLLGYTCTIRYTEGLLGLPLLLVVLLSARWWQKRWWLEAFWALAGWAIPIGLMVAYNYAAMGRITGYDGTNESVGFRWEYAADNWEPAVRQLSTIALFLIFPFSVIGLIVMVVRRWRMGVVLAAWALPCLIVYTFYYWAPDPPNQTPQFVSYVRFFATVLPALVMSAYWLFNQISTTLRAADADVWVRRATKGVFGMVTLIAIFMHLQNSTYAVEMEQLTRGMLQMNTQRVLATVPRGSVLFATDTSLLQHLQFAGDYTLYSGETFNKWHIDSLRTADPSEPQGWDPGRRAALYERFKDMNQQQLDEQQRRLMILALDSDRRVFFLLSRHQNDPPPRQRRANPQPAADARRAAAQAEARRVFPGGDIVRRFATPDRFDFDVVATWHTPVVRPPVVDPNRPAQRRVEMRLNRAAASWELVEIVKKPPAPPEPPTPRPVPATRPASRPARNPPR